MQIKGIKLSRIRIPLIKPFETSFGRITERPAILVAITATDGTVGYGEASPLSVPISEPETDETGMAFLRACAPQLIGLPVERGYDITKHYPNNEHPVSRIGLEAAYLDLIAKAANVPVADLFGQHADSVAVGESVSMYSTIAETIDAVREYLSRDFARIKIKIAPGHDREVVHAVHEAFPDCRFGLDGNAAYATNDLELLSLFAVDYVSFVEQPFAADNIDAHAALRRRGVLVCLDESVRDLLTLQRALRARACDMVNIKPARIGSFNESMQVYDLCLNEGLQLFGGGRLETGIGKSMNAAFYALPGFTIPSDLTAPSEYLAGDIVSPQFNILHARYEIPQAPGIGRIVDYGALRPYIRETFSCGDSRASIQREDW